MLPSDENIWLAYTGVIDYPMLMAALKLKIFDCIAGHGGATLQQVVSGCVIGHRSATVLLNHLTAMGILRKKQGKFSLSPAAAAYLASSQSSYWGNAMLMAKGLFPLYDRLLSAIEADSKETSRAGALTSGWKEGKIDPAKTADFTRVMHVFSLYPAQEAARSELFASVKNLLDVGAGSGNFSIAIAQKWPKIRCTLMDFPAVCEVAQEFVTGAGLQDRISSAPLNMFTDEWPSGFDGIFMANILHDWSDPTCEGLLGKAYKALPAGGQIFICEVLLAPGETSPRVATGLSATMLVQTEGRQFTRKQLADMLKAAGFKKIASAGAGGLYHVVRGTK